MTGAGQVKPVDSPTELVERLELWCALREPLPTVSYASVCELLTASLHYAREHDALLLEVEWLKAALRKSAALIERMYLAGPDCDCEPEGHHCGWPSLRDVHEHNQRALSPASGGV